MSPSSAGRAEKLGYTNVKVYHDGLPEWSKRNYAVLSAQSLKAAFLDKDVPNVLVDVRPASLAEKGFIKGAVTVPAADIAANISKFPPKDKKPPIIIYDQNGGDDAKNAAKTLISSGYSSVTLLTGGFDAWKGASYPAEAGKLATAIVYVQKPRPGEISIEEFKKIVTGIPADTIVLDVRSPEETNAGMIKGAKNLPDSDLLDRLAEVPKDKQIITYCNSGVQAEMAYHKLKEKGYSVAFLNAKVTFDDKGNYTIEKL
jgi:rhodanese-related sulfurtransferase